MEKPTYLNQKYYEKIKNDSISALIAFNRVIFDIICDAFDQVTRIPQNKFNSLHDYVIQINDKIIEESKVRAFEVDYFQTKLEALNFITRKLREELIPPIYEKHVDALKSFLTEFYEKFILADNSSYNEIEPRLSCVWYRFLHFIIEEKNNKAKEDDPMRKVWGPRLKGIEESIHNKEALIESQSYVKETQDSVEEDKKTAESIKSSRREIDKVAFDKKEINKSIADDYKSIKSSFEGSFNIVFEKIGKLDEQKDSAQSMELLNGILKDFDSIVNGSSKDIKAFKQNPQYEEFIKKLVSKWDEKLEEINSEKKVQDEIEPAYNFETKFNMFMDNNDFGLAAYAIRSRLESYCKYVKGVNICGNTIWLSDYNGNYGKNLHKLRKCFSRSVAEKINEKCYSGIQKSVHDSLESMNPACFNGLKQTMREGFKLIMEKCGELDQTSLFERARNYFLGINNQFHNIVEENNIDLYKKNIDFKTLSNIEADFQDAKNTMKDYYADEYKDLLDMLRSQNIVIYKGVKIKDENIIGVEDDDL